MSAADGQAENICSGSFTGFDPKLTLAEYGMRLRPLKL